MNKSAVILGMALLLAGSGCQPSPSNQKSSTTEGQSEPSSELAEPLKPQVAWDGGEGPFNGPGASPPDANAPPQEVVSAFLEATRAGDEQQASALLTRKALEETALRGLTVQPPGSPSMTYKIGAVEAAPNNRGVYVSSTWTESFGEGQAETFEVVWVLREEPSGWRIAGMAAQLEADEPPLFLNFEEPTELARTMTARNEVREKRAEPPQVGQPAQGDPVYQAEQPKTPNRQR